MLSDIPPAARRRQSLRRCDDDQRAGRLHPDVPRGQHLGVPDVDHLRVHVYAGLVPVLVSRVNRAVISMTISGN